MSMEFSHLFEAGSIQEQENISFEKIRISKKPRVLFKNGFNLLGYGNYTKLSKQVIIIFLFAL